MSGHRHPSLIDEFSGPGNCNSDSLSRCKGRVAGTIEKRRGIDDETNGPGGRFFDAN